MKWKKDEEGALVLDGDGNPIAVSESGEVIPLDKVVALGKHQRVESERDEYKAQADKLAAQIAELEKNAGDKEALAAQLAEMKAEAEKAAADFDARMAVRDREHALDTALLGAGVPAPRLKAAKALIDPEALTLTDGKLAGLDLDAFKADAAYLFETAAPVASAAASRGAAGDADDAKMRAVMGLAPKE